MIESREDTGTIPTEEESISKYMTETDGKKTQESSQTHRSFRIPAPGEGSQELGIPARDLHLQFTRLPPVGQESIVPCGNDPVVSKLTRLRNGSCGQASRDGCLDCPPDTEEPRGAPDHQPITVRAQAGHPRTPRIGFLRIGCRPPIQHSTAGWIQYRNRFLLSNICTKGRERK